MTPALTLADPAVRAILADVRAGYRIGAAAERNGYNPKTPAHWHRRVAGWTDALALAQRWGGRTGHAKRAYLELIAQGVPSGEAARHLGKPVSSPHTWARYDPEFAAARAAIMGRGLGANVEFEARFRRLLIRLYAGEDLIDAARAEGYCLSSVRRWRKRGNGRWHAVTRALALGGGTGLVGEMRRGRAA